MCRRSISVASVNAAQRSFKATSLGSSPRRPTNIMKTEKQVKEELAVAKKRLKQVQAQFDEYDNHDDMDELERIRAEITTLVWVLK